MIPIPSSYRVYLSTGVTDMRRGMPGLSLQVQEALGRDPHGGDLYVFRGRKGDFIKVLWHDGLGLSLYAKRLERGRFIWPSPADGVVSISAAQLGYLLEGIDWRHPQRTWRPAAAGWLTRSPKGATKPVECAVLRRMVDVNNELEALKAELAAERAARLAAEAKVSSIDALIASLKLQIEKLRRELYGQRSERKARLLDQMELELEELEASATEDELKAEMAAKEAGTEIKAHTRKKPSRKPFPEHLPRERVVIPAPTSCNCCGSTKLAKLGEDITETLEVIPRQWKVIQYVREKFTCRHCESISQPPAPFHVIPRGFAGPSLLAMILFEKYGVHQPLNRQSERYAKEGVDLSLSTMADLVGACTVVLRPLVDLIEAHVLKADRLHADDTPIRVLAKGQCKKATAWAYVRDDRPFGGSDPPAVLFHYSRNRKGEHPTRHLAQFAGVLQADAYSGFNPLLDPERASGPITPALCWAHSRRKFFELADLMKQARSKKQLQISPMALEAVKRIDVLFDIERAINGRPAEERLRIRK